MNPLEPSGASSLRDVVDGVAVGMVVDHKDPGGLGRVKVRYQGIAEDGLEFWARIAVPMAGASRGIFFLPEVEDEVLLAFEHGDMTRPYILGALWNSKDVPPDTNSDGKNNLRLIKSRSGHLVRFDDTDGKEKIEIIDKTGNNKITFDAANNTITVESAKDIVLKASQGTIRLDAKTVEIKSSADTKVEAGSTLDVKASGTLTLKGATVNIN